MKSINQHNDLPSSNRPLLHSRYVRLSSSTPSMVKPPLIGMERTKSFWIHGDTSPRLITRKSYLNLCCFFFFLNLLASFPHPHPLSFRCRWWFNSHLFSWSFHVFPQNVCVCVEWKSVRGSRSAASICDFFFSPVFTFRYQGVWCGREVENFREIREGFNKTR